jgi:hypothetical protein
LRRFFGPTILIGGICVAVLALTAEKQPDDPIIFTFAVTGDSRQDAKATNLSPQEKIWMENTKSLARIIREIQAQKPQALFFTGDMIMGYSSDFAETDRQYAYWRGMMATLIENGIYVLPVSGNHEMQVKTDDPNGGKPLKISDVRCENLWRENMGDLLLDTNLWDHLTGTMIENWDINNIPPIGGADNIQSDQRQLTLSFDVDKMHFIVINTSAYKDNARAPIHWLADDFAKAKARGAQDIFVFGHEMAFTYQFGDKDKESGLDTFPGDAKEFWNLIQAYHATYFTAHEHLYHASQPVPGTHSSWQIICGAAGAPFDAKPGESPNDNLRTYAWVRVQVHRSGRVHMDAYGFDEHFGPTKLIQSIEL